MNAGKPLSRLPILLAVSALGLLSACRAPGMKMTYEALKVPATVDVDGQRITLRPLNAQSVLSHGTPSAVFEGLQDLLATKTAPYRIGPLDTLLVTVWDHPELTLPLGQYRTDAATGMVVDEEGFLYYPYIGRVKVAGLTVVQVRETLISKLDRVLQRPQVDVKVIGYRSQKVFVGGEVRTPALHNITDVPFTLAEAINRAGGFLPTADQSRVLLARGDRTWSLNFLELLAQGNRIGQIQLRDGDSLHIHQKDEAPVYLMGEVVRPGIIPTHHGRLTLAQALSEAGGVNNQSSSPRSIYVIRRGKAENGVDVFHLDAHNPVAMVMADRFSLQPRDLVFVDAGTLVRWNRVVTMLLPTTNLLGTIPNVAADARTAWK